MKKKQERAIAVPTEIPSLAVGQRITFVNGDPKAVEDRVRKSGLWYQRDMELARLRRS